MVSNGRDASLFGQKRHVCIVQGQKVAEGLQPRGRALQYRVRDSNSQPLAVVPKVLPTDHTTCSFPIFTFFWSPEVTWLTSAHARYLTGLISRAVYTLQGCKQHQWTRLSLPYTIMYPNVQLYVVDATIVHDLCKVTTTLLGVHPAFAFEICDSDSEKSDPFFGKSEPVTL